MHRWLVAQGIESIVVDSASIEVNRRARRTKTDRLDDDKLPTMLMGGLASLFILAKLQAIRTTAASQIIITQVLNPAPDTEALAGAEPVEEPIVDDPAYDWSDQIRDYEIGMVVA